MVKSLPGVALLSAGLCAARLSFDDGASSVYPDLAFGAGRAAVTWWDTRDGNAEVYLAVVDAQELPRGIESAASRVTARLRVCPGMKVLSSGILQAVVRES